MNAYRYEHEQETIWESSVESAGAAPVRLKKAFSFTGIHVSISKGSQ